ncbi:MAG TPA: hypothetical protein VJO99_20525 [Burkholderiaceae bacterium]|nr:hypothetical protein [Burkholderiaceae bacterium]
MITITDLPVSRALDVKVMSALRGAGGAPWVFGAFQPYFEPVPSVGSAVNFYQVSNNFYQVTNNFTSIDKVVNQFTTLDIKNSGDHANLTTVLLGAQTAS